MMAKSSYISRTVLYYVIMIAWLTLLFQAWRGILLLSVSGPAVVPGAELVKAFVVGLRFDLAISCYIVAPLVLLGAIPGWDLTARRWVRWLNFTLLVAMVAAAFFIQLVDIEFFRFFNHRLNAMVLQWSDTPGFMFAMVWQSYPVVRWLLIYTVMLGVFIAGARLALRRVVVFRPSHNSRFVAALSLPFLLAGLFLGMRGGIEEKAPLTWGAAYFSTHSFANQLALNPNFTFFRDAVYDANGAADVERTMARVRVPDAPRIVGRLIGRGGGVPEDGDIPFNRVIFEPEDDNPPNVILVIMESFGSSLVGTLDGRSHLDLSPHFDSLAAQGILFTDFYSNGMHTYTGLFSTLYGLPTIPGRSVMKRVVHEISFWGLPSVLRKHGYETLFFTTHDPHFDNMQGFLMANGISRVISGFDYEAGEKLSTLGVADHVMFDRALEELKALGSRRYFATLLTSSHHGPWIVPDVGLAPFGENVPHHKQLNAFRYSDWALGRFFRTLTSDPAFANTVVVVTSDNGFLYAPSLDLDLSQFRIPLFVYDPRHTERRGGRPDRLGSQMDILATVMGLVRLNYEDHSFGSDLLDPDSRRVDFAQFSEGFDIGYIEGSHYLIWRLGAPASLFEVRKGEVVGPGDGDTSETVLIRKARALLQSAYAVAAGTQIRSRRNLYKPAPHEMTQVVPSR